MYLEGTGVEKDYNKAKKYFEIAAENKIDAHYNLGMMYKKGLGDAIDCLKAKKHFEIASSSRNTVQTSALYQLGILYYNGKLMKQDFNKAREYFEKSSQLKYSKAFFKLGMMYKYGQGVDINYDEAKKYFELSELHQYSKGLFQIAILHFNGLLNNYSYKKAKEYFEISLQKQDFNSAFYLGLMYEKGLGVKRDLLKAIEYYKQCSLNRNSKYAIRSNDHILQVSIEKKKIYNQYYYQSNNDLGLIYITEKEHENKELAEQYIKESGLNEYPFGQNNLALFSQFYLNKIGDAEYLFGKASKKKFSLSEFNLGYLCEIDGKINESIQHYIKASDYENEPMIFRNQIINDERLDISKTFIICYTNLKLSQSYLSKQQQKSQVKLNERISNEYFMKAMFHHLFSLIFHLKKYSYSFNFQTEKSNEKYIITNLKDFILNNPLFHYWDEIMPIQQNAESFGWKISEPNTNNNFELNLIIHTVESNANIKIDIDNNSDKVKYSIDEKNALLLSQNYENENFQKDDEIKNHFEFMNKQGEFEIVNDEGCNENQNDITNQDKSIEIMKIKMKGNDIKWTFKYSKKLNEFLINTLKENQKEIDDIINEMKKILYTQPYSILFGRINIYKEKETEINKSDTKNIDDDFNDGFGISDNI